MTTGPRQLKAGNDPASALTVQSEAHIAVRLAGDPTAMIKEARQAAEAMMSIIKAKPESDQVIMNGKNYLVFEDWQTLGRFFNLVPRTREDKLIQFQTGNGRSTEGGRIITGWEATADVVDIISGAVISSATAMCLDDEEKWSTRNLYKWCYCLKAGGHSVEDPGAGEMVWIDRDPPVPGKSKQIPKKERVHVGEESVPQFQLRSMAQTRAGAKAMRQTLAWIAVLAGCAPTPAEELDNNANHPTDQVVDAEFVEAKPKPPAAPAAPAEPRRKEFASPPPGNYPGSPTAHRAQGGGPAEPAAAQPKPAMKPISVAQLRRFWAIASENNWTEREVETMILMELKIEKASEIPTGRNYYDRIVTILTGGTEAYFAKEARRAAGSN